MLIVPVQPSKRECVGREMLKVDERVRNGVERCLKITIDQIDKGLPNIVTGGKYFQSNAWHVEPEHSLTSDLELYQQQHRISGFINDHMLDCMDSTFAPQSTRETSKSRSTHDRLLGSNASIRHGRFLPSIRFTWPSAISCRGSKSYWVLRPRQNRSGISMPLLSSNGPLYPIQSRPPLCPSPPGPCYQHAQFLTSWPL